jgi:hypothetical protein
LLQALQGCMLILLPILLLVTLLEVVDNFVAIPSYMPSFSLHKQCLHPHLLVCPLINDHKKSHLHLHLHKQATLLEPQSCMHLKVYLEVLLHQHHKVVVVISFFLFKSPMFTRKWGTKGIDNVASDSSVSYEIFKLPI